MKIVELNLIDFGKFHNQIIDFSTGLNVLYGENESGKTTIFKFIEGIFYGFAKSYLRTLRTTADYDKYMPWEGRNYRGSILFETNSNKYRIYRDFISKEYYIYDETTGTDISPELEGYSRSNLSFPGEFFFGIGSELFSKVFVIQEDLLSMEDQTKEILQDQLTQHSAQALESFSAYSSLQYLVNLKNEIGTTKAKKKPLGSLHHERENLLKELESLEDIRKEYEISISQLRALEEERELLEKEFSLSQTQALFEERSRLESAMNMKNNLNNEIKSLELEIKTSHLLNTVSDEEIDQYISNLHSLDRIKNDYDRISTAKKECFQRLKKLHSEFHLNKDVENRYKEIEKRYMKNKKLSKRIQYIFFFSILPLLMFLYSYYSGQINVFYISLVLLAAVILAVLLLFSAQKKLKDEIKQKTKSLVMDYDLPKLSTKELLQNYMPLHTDASSTSEYTLIQEQIEDYDLRIDHLIRQEDEKTEELRAFLFKIDKVDILTFEELENLKNREKSIIETCIQKKSLLKQVESEFDFTRLNYLRDLKLEKKDVEKFETINEKVRDNSTKISALKERISFLEPKLEQLLESTERVEELNVKIEYYNNRRKGIELAIESINLAKNNIYKNYIPRINNMLSTLMSELRGEGAVFKMGDQFNLSFLNSSDKYISEESLSSGTFDQIMILIRLFLIEEIFKDEFPLILDDAFIRTDQRRLGILLDYLAEISDYRQILLFTCQQREKELLDNKNIEYHYMNL